MTVNFNPSDTRLSPSAARRAGDRKNRPDFQNDDESALPASRADVNFIPSPDSLATLIRSAISALRRGVTWDRGTILNLVV